MGTVAISKPLTGKNTVPCYFYCSTELHSWGYANCHTYIASAMWFPALQWKLYPFFVSQSLTLSNKIYGFSLTGFDCSGNFFFLSNLDAYFLRHFMIHESKEVGVNSKTYYHLVDHTIFVLFFFCAVNSLFLQNQNLLFYGQKIGLSTSGCNVCQIIDIWYYKVFGLKIYVTSMS